MLPGEGWRGAGSARSGQSRQRERGGRSGAGANCPPNPACFPGPLSLAGSRRSAAWLVAAFALSGFAALGYQFLWIRVLTGIVGSETLAVTGVVSGFFLGMAFGAWAIQRPVQVVGRPAALFAGLEAVTGLFALVSPWFLPWGGEAMLGLCGASGGAAGMLASSLLTSVLLLLLPSACMGGTLPALVAAGARQGAGTSLDVGRLYGANTVGATLGVLASVYLLFPAAGFAWGAVVLGGCGLLSAGLALVWDAGRKAVSRADAGDGNDLAHLAADVEAGERAKLDLEPGLDDLETVTGGGQGSGGVRSLLFLAGLAGIGLELVAVRVLAQVTQSTVYTFANLLAVYLVGTAAGALTWSRVARGRRAPAGQAAGTSAPLLLALAALTGLCGWALAAAPRIIGMLAPGGSGFARQCLAEFVAAALVFLPPTFVMGMLFSHLLAGEAARGRATGTAYAVNTLGGALAAALYVLLAIPAAGYRGALLAVGGTYLLGAALLSLRLPERRVWLGALAGTLLFFAVMPRLVLVPLAPGWRILSEWQGVMGLTRVTQTASRSGTGSASGVRMLQVDRHFFMGGGRGIPDHRMGRMPLVLAPDSRSVLFLGVGTGATAGAVTEWPSVEHADAVELVPEVLAALPWFDAVNSGVRLDRRVRFHAADAVRFAASPPRRYDLVVGDLFHPQRDGAASLYTAQHFIHVRDRCLEPGGLFCQWIPLYQFDPESLRIVMRTFNAVFPETCAFLGDSGAEAPLLMLVGRRPAPGQGPLKLRIDREQIRASGSSLTRVEALDVLGSFLLDHQAMVAFAGEGPGNERLNPRLLFHVPRAQRKLGDALAWKSLDVLYRYQTAPSPDLVEAPALDVRDEVLTRAAARARAMRCFFEGDMLRVTSTPALPPPDGALRKFEESASLDPSFRPARLMLRMLGRGR